MNGIQDGRWRRGGGGGGSEKPGQVGVQAMAGRLEAAATAVP